MITIMITTTAKTKNLGVVQGQRKTPKSRVDGRLLRRSEGRVRRRVGPGIVTRGRVDLRNREKHDRRKMRNRRLSP